MNPHRRYVVTVTGEGVVFEGPTRERADWWFTNYCQDPRNTVRLHNVETGEVVKMREGKESAACRARSGSPSTSR